MHGIPVHLRLGAATLCGVAGPIPGTRDTSVVTCEICRTLIRASGFAQPRAAEADAWAVARRHGAEARAGST